VVNDSYSNRKKKRIPQSSIQVEFTLNLRRSIYLFQIYLMDETVLYRLKNLNNHNVISIFKDQFKIGRATSKLIKYSFLIEILGI